MPNWTFVLLNNFDNFICSSLSIVSCVKTRWSDAKTYETKPSEVMLGVR